MKLRQSNNAGRRGEEPFDNKQTTISYSSACKVHVDSSSSSSK